MGPKKGPDTFSAQAVGRLLLSIVGLLRQQRLGRDICENVGVGVGTDSLFSFS